MMEDTHESRNLLKLKEREVDGVYSDLHSVRKSITQDRFFMLLELGKSLMKLEDYVAYYPKSPAQDASPDAKPEKEIIEVDLCGHPDSVLWHKDRAKPQALLEVKTTNCFSYRKINSLAFQDPSYKELDL